MSDKLLAEQAEEFCRDRGDNQPTSDLTMGLINLIDAIAAELNGEEWDSSTCDSIASHIRGAGWAVCDIDNEED